MYIWPRNHNGHRSMYIYLFPQLFPQLIFFKSVDNFFIFIDIDPNFFCVPSEHRSANNVYSLNILFLKRSCLISLALDYLLDYLRDKTDTSETNFLVPLLFFL